MIVYHHLGLGDHIICNGLVRTLADERPVEVLCKNNNLASVRFMFRDDSRISVLGVADDAEALALFQSSGPSKLKIGHENLPRFMSGGKQFDEALYLQCGIDFQKRWSKFRCDRDIAREQRLLSDVGLRGEEYVFIHDDSSRGFAVAYALSSKKVIRPVIGLTDNIFDYCGIIEGAAEVHCIDSSFCAMIDSMLDIASPFLWLAFDAGVKDFSVARKRLNWQIDIEGFDPSKYLYFTEEA